MSESKDAILVLPVSGNKSRHLEPHFRFRFWRFHLHRHVTLHRPRKLHWNRTGELSHFDFSRRRP